MDIIYHNNNTTRGLSTHRHGRLVLLRAQSMLDHVLWAVFWTDAWVRTRLVSFQLETMRRRIAPS